MRTCRKICAAFEGAAFERCQARGTNAPGDRHAALSEGLDAGASNRCLAAPASFSYVNSYVFIPSMIPRSVSLVAQPQVHGTMSRLDEVEVNHCVPILRVFQSAAVIRSGQDPSARA